MYQKALRKVLRLRAQISNKFRTAQQSRDIIRPSLVSCLVYAAHQILRMSFTIINHDTAAVNPYRQTVFVKPPIMKIMYLFFSFAYIRKMPCKHPAVIFIYHLHDSIGGISNDTAGYHKPIHSRLGNLKCIILQIKYVQIIIHGFSDYFK